MNRPIRRSLPTGRTQDVRAAPQGNGHYDSQDTNFDPGNDAGSSGPGAGGGTHAPNLFRVLHRLLRGRYLLTFSLAGAVAIIGAISGFISTKPMFRTTATVRVQSQLPGGMSGYGGSSNSLAYIATQAALMRNDRVLQIAMEHEDWKALGLGTGPEVQEALMDSLEISQVPGSTELLSLTSTHRDSHFTKAAVRSILQAFSKFGETDDRRVQDATTAVYRDRKNQTERAIREASELVTELSKEFGTTDLRSSIEQKTLLINAAEAQLNELALRLAELPNPVDPANATPLTPDIESSNHRWTPQEIANVDLSMRAYLDAEGTATANYESLRLRFSDQHIAVKHAADDLARIRIKIERYASQWVPASGLTSGARVLSLSDRDGLEREIKSKTEVRDALVAERSRMNLTQQRITSATDQVKRDEAKLGEIQASIDALNVRLQIAIQISPTGRMEVVSDGSTPLKPSVDRRKQFAAAGFVLGGGFPIVAMLLLGLIDRRLRFSDDTADNGINAPLLGILPILPADLRDQERRTMAAHCVHNIRVLLQLSGEVGGAKVFAITSPTAGDGKTSLVLSLGLSFAASGSRTVLVDFDTVGTGLSASLDVRGGNGVLEAIRTGNVAGCVRPSGVDDNLFIIPSSPGDDIHVSRVSTNSVRRLVAALRERFDAVLIDTGPILGSIEASLAAAQADGVVLVIGRGQHHNHVKRAVERILAVGGRVAGMVFNRATASDFRRSVSTASMRSIPRALPSGPGGRGIGLSNAGPIATVVARDVDQHSQNGTP